ncbi:TetR/AcrR family transcriptional regulator [Mycolicibacterium sp. XJ870]
MHIGRLTRMPAERRQRLVHVAAAEFASSGYRDASLNRIISLCGMSKSSFYYVIDSKSDLFDFVVRELLSEIGPDIGADGVIPDPEQFEGEHFWARTAEFFTHLVSIAEKHQSFAMLGRMFYSDAPNDAKDAISGALNAVRDWVERLLRVGRSCGAVRDDLPEALQYRLVVGVLQIFDEWTVQHYGDFTPAELNTLADRQFATLKRLVAGPGPTVHTSIG